MVGKSPGNHTVITKKQPCNHPVPARIWVEKISVRDRWGTDWISMGLRWNANAICRMFLFAGAKVRKINEICKFFVEKMSAGGKMENYAKWGNIPDRCADPDNPENPGGNGSGSGCLHSMQAQ